MANPPAVVKLALESMCLLLSATPDPDTAPDWKTIRSILQKDSFIPSIINFDTSSITYAIFQICRKKTLHFPFILYVSINAKQEPGRIYAHVLLSISVNNVCVWLIQNLTRWARNQFFFLFFFSTLHIMSVEPFSLSSSFVPTTQYSHHINAPKQTHTADQLIRVAKCEWLASGQCAVAQLLANANTMNT